MLPWSQLSALVEGY
ncbi:hypothetical protein LINGRAHAP2_LOCUS34856 [Linum grandiflorum]